MSQTIEAIYENGIFRPLSPVDLPEGTRVRVAPGEWPANTDDLVREYLLSAGTPTVEVEQILDNLHLLWGSYDSLTEQQQVEFDESRLNQEHFFDHHPQQ
jgi:predicted DNA-binding antitoxin AbrB/MazE fold protein